MCQKLRFFEFLAKTTLNDLLQIAYINKQVCKAMPSSQIQGSGEEGQRGFSFQRRGMTDVSTLAAVLA